ncbi:ubiquinol-cytochrome c reductase iron-sulfur subunit [Aquibacillus koreensis]|uniref:Menaquinol:cytochrome c reductase iron-sulfur subunit n=1 Tax=Aquibacillus koreensis TaxID=279446 RepID=A0A9X3WFF8_9BACI|nr:ubiquinol-cytochrome c reductase iron-sulfur subunit [Aquibacillus koreensis]MCT2537374.1 ubiquinol-cytochrome c reductase iron-sulfur subunit [Aquibacillus koreensis]MDC3418820.1 ubiquinol-cytochrome c reductase iron-sulfur subunit [Aquibacillus koreensis]
MSEKRNQVSRRQFLNYTLTGVGGFMAAGMLAPMVRFAIDPVLQPQGKGEFTAVAQVDEITSEPQRVDWTIDQVDAWYESEVTKSAWVYKQEDGSIVALSPVCKHLGCVVAWAGNDDYPDQFFCPCHDGRYYKDGENVPGTPPNAALDRFQQRIEDGTLYLGKAIPREEA